MDTALVLTNPAIPVALTVGLVLLAVFYGKLVQDARFNKRLHQFVIHAEHQGVRAESSHARSQRSIDRALKEIDDLKRARRKKTLSMRLKRAGLDLTAQQFTALRVILGLVSGLLFFLIKGSIPVSVIVSAAVGVGLPILFLNMLENRRFNQMADEFPDALDVVIRGIRTGMPLIDCFQMLALEGTEPLRSEFERLRNDLNVGLSLEEAVHRFASRVPMQEASFFAIVIAIQSKSGGSLSEAIANLSSMLRERKKLQGKIKAMSSEARASAWIIGSLPVLVTGVVYVTSPDFISVLFTTLTGNLVLAGCAFWMLLGTIVMKSMIKIDL